MKPTGRHSAFACILRGIFREFSSDPSFHERFDNVCDELYLVFLVTRRSVGLVDQEAWAACVPLEMSLQMSPILQNLGDASFVVGCPR